MEIRSNLTTRVLSRWSSIPLQITCMAQHGCPQQLGSEPMAEEVFPSLLYVRIRTESESFEFPHAYQINTFATSQFITTCYLAFNCVTQECKLTWSAILIIIIVGEQMGLRICKYLISHVVVACMWKYPVWLRNHTESFGLYNDACSCYSCIRRIRPSVLIMLHHSVRFWALNLASQYSIPVATNTGVVFKFSILRDASSWLELNGYSGLPWHKIRLILTEKNPSVAVIVKRIWLYLLRHFSFQSSFLTRAL